jgi:CheY-like chemotaxis protein
VPEDFRLADNMPFAALIVSAHDHDIRVLQEVLQELHVETEICTTASMAEAALLKQPVDAVLLDGDMPGVLDVIDALARRQEAESPRIIAILSTKDGLQSPFEMGAHFVLYKPISRDRSLVSLESALRSSDGERRLTNRRGVYFSTTVSSPTAEDVPVALFDLSSTGTTLQARKRLPSDSKLYFEFQIPGQSSTVRLSGNVVWQDSQGRAGIRFASVPTASRKALEQWLENADRDEPEELPEVAMEVERFGPMDRPGDRDPQPQSVVVRQNLVVPERKERRAQSRYRFDAGIRVSDQRSAIPNWCNIADISRGGCYIEFVTPFPKGTLLNLEVRAAGMRLRTCGKVQSSQSGKGMGIQFNIENDEQRHQINQIVEFLAVGSSLRK